MMRFDEPMSGHTVWGVGGAARRCYVPANIDDLALLLSGLPEGEPVFWVGLGSNLLVRDAGIDGTVILTAGALGEMHRHGPDGVTVQAGVACAKVARFCASAGLCGCEFFAGIPGTVGGAVAMNAGAFGTETWEIVERVHTIDRRGKRRVRGAEAFKVSYRAVEGPPGEWYTAADLRLRTGAAEASLATTRELLRRRARTQPTGRRSCGSVFRNPPGDFAGRLIEQCGLKSRRRGAAVVSDKHANFILNAGGATAADIEGLILEVQHIVKQETGVELVPEVHIVGRQAGEA